MERIMKVLEDLSNVHGVSGRERMVINLLEKHMRPYIDEMKVDKFGNFVATHKGDGKGPTIMIAAHMDEVGLMVKYIDDNGFLRFVKIGGWFDPTLHSQRVIVHTKNGPLTGVIGSKPPHAMTEKERGQLIKTEDMFIDVGAESKKDAEEMGIFSGVSVTVDRELTMLGKNRITGKALDDRAGLTAMIEAARMIKEMNSDFTIHFVGTSQEEVGGKGGKTSVFGLNPDVVLVVDTTVSGDHPGIEKQHSALEIGKGPAIVASDANGRGYIASEKVLQWLTYVAENKEVLYQIEVGSGGTTTDAHNIQIERDGFRTGVIKLPLRYIHSPVEVMDIRDIKGGAELIAEAVTSHFLLGWI